MRLSLVACVSLLVWSSSAYAQQPIQVDLATTSTLTRTVDPGQYQVRIKNRLPRPYDVTIHREFREIPPISLEGISGLAGKTIELSAACPALSAAKDALAAADAERNVPALRAAVEAELTTCTNAALVAAAKAIVNLTEAELDPIALRRSEKVVITLTRPAANGTSETRTITLETESAGKWITAFGFSFVADSDDLFNSEAAGEGKFKIVKEAHTKAIKKPIPSVYFSWMGSEARYKTGTWSPTVGFGLGDTAPTVFGGVSYTFNHNLSIIGGVAVAGVRKLNGRYQENQVVSENLTQEQLLRTVYRPTAVVALSLRFDRNPFEGDEKPAAPAAPTAPSSSEKPSSNSSGNGTTPDPAPASAMNATPEASRASDLKLRFNAKGDLADPKVVEAIAARAKSASDVFIVSHGWWNNENAADCFYQRIIGGIDAAKPAYLTPDRFQPLYVSVYWPSALFPMEPSDCGGEGRTESSRSPAFTPDRVAQWASSGFPDAATRAGYQTEVNRVAALLERERTASISDAEGVELAEILVAWRNAAGTTSAAGDGAEPGAFEGTGKEIAQRWQSRPEVRSEFSIPTLANSKKWLNFGNAFTFWTMKERAGIVGAKGLSVVLAALQPLRQSGVRIHLIGHSFGGKLVTAGLTGNGGNQNHANSLIILQGAFSQFAFASRAEIEAARVTVDRDGLYRDVLAKNLVDGPIVATFSSADLPNRILYPAGVALRNDVTETTRTPRYGSLGANGMRASPSAAMDLAVQTLSVFGQTLPRAISVDGGQVIGGHSDLVKPQVFKLIWDLVEHGR